MVDTIDNSDEMSDSNNDITNESEHTTDCHSTADNFLVDEQKNTIATNDGSLEKTDVEGTPIFDSNDESNTEKEKHKSDVDIEDIDESDLSFGNSPCPD
jgi:hypothetical protein